MNRTTRRLGMTALVLACSALVGCERKPANIPPPELQEVLYSEPVTKQITDYEEFTGRMDAIYTIEIRARVSGYLNRVYFKDGAEVREGDLLFEIDPRPYKADLDQAKAAVVQAEAHLKRLKADYQRATSLYSRGAISREEMDRIAGDHAEAEAAVGIAEARRNLAELNLEYTKVHAPISGRLSRRLVDPGNLVKADETPLTTIVTLDPMYVYFDVDERTLLRLRRLLREGKIQSSRQTDVPVLIALSDEEGFPHKGLVNFSDNKVDINTGTLRVRGSVENADRILSPGLFVRVRLQVGKPHKALMVPEQALVTDQGRKFVYVVKDGQDAKGGQDVLYRPVKVGRLEEGLRVVDEGLKPGEKVVVNGLQRIKRGKKVKATPAPESTVEVSAAEAGAAQVASQ